MVKVIYLYIGSISVPPSLLGPRPFAHPVTSNHRKPCRRFGCRVAKLKGHKVLKPENLSTYLARTWNLRIPGFGPETVLPYRKPPVASQVEQRLAHVHRQTLRAHAISLAAQPVVATSPGQPTSLALQELKYHDAAQFATALLVCVKNSLHMLFEAKDMS